MQVDAHETDSGTSPGTGAKRRCRLCGDWGARERPKRLGRYFLTCDACEERRGSHRIGGSAGTSPPDEPAAVVATT